MKNLYQKDASELFAYSSVQELEKMASQLIEMGYEDAARETLHLLYTVKQAKTRVSVLKQRMEGVWIALSEYERYNWDKEKVEEEIRKYRGEVKCD